MTSLMKRVPPGRPAGEAAITATYSLFEGAPAEDGYSVLILNVPANRRNKLSKWGSFRGPAVHAAWN